MHRNLWFAVAAIVLLLGFTTVPRWMLYFPTHAKSKQGLAEWILGERRIGLARPVTQPHTVWLLLHGNAGQAADRRYALPNFSPEDAVHILEYPGYGQREGRPSLEAFNAAAREGYEFLRKQYPGTPVCVAGESIGTGPGCHLASLPRPPDKLVLITPFAVLKDVADEHFPYLPTSLLLRDNWDNIAALKTYTGPLEIFAARDDTLIPIRHARALAASRPQTVFHEIPGGHNNWSGGGHVRIRHP